MDAKLKYDDDVAAYNGQMQQFEAVSQQQSQAQQAAVQAYLQQEMETPETADSRVFGRQEGIRSTRKDADCWFRGLWISAGRDRSDHGPPRNQSIA